jgi:tetratricopeptide (TPR) repeat protein
MPNSAILLWDYFKSCQQFLVVLCAAGCGVIPILVKLNMEFFALRSFREACGHWASSFLVGALFIVLSALPHILTHTCYPWRASVPFLLLAIPLLLRGAVKWWQQYRLPDDRLIVGIVPFKPVGEATAGDAHVIEEEIRERLGKRNEEGAPIECRRLRGELNDATGDEKTEARKRGQSFLDPRSHVVIHGKAKRYGEVSFDVSVLIANPLRNARLEGDRETGAAGAEPDRLEVKNLAASQTADLVTLLYGMAYYKVGNWSRAIPILEQASLTEAAYYRALCHHEEGLRSTTPQKHLWKAVKVWQAILEKATQESDPANRAMPQNNLGIALSALGTRAGGEDGTRYLLEAVEAYRNALEVYTQGELPQQWAITQNNLGNALTKLGTRAGGEEATRYLSDAVAAFRNALTVRKQGELPQQWAMTQNNLGIALSELGERAGGDEGNRNLQAAVTAYRNASQVFKLGKLPQQWATTQNNLGTALQELGERAGGEEGTRYLSEAVEAYRNALTVRTRGDLPQDWAATQNNIGNALRNLGTLTGGDKGNRYLHEAVTAYRDALEVYTQGELPQQWAATQNNLGIALGELGRRAGGEEGTRYLSEAVEAYRNALTVRTRGDLPQQWAMTQNNIGAELQELGKRAGGETGRGYVRQAIAAYECALEVYTAEQFLYHHNGVGRNKAMAVQALADMQDR